MNSLHSLWVEPLNNLANFSQKSLGVRRLLAGLIASSIVFRPVFSIIHLGLDIPEAPFDW